MSLIDDNNNANNSIFGNKPHIIYPTKLQQIPDIFGHHFDEDIDTRNADDEVSSLIQNCRLSPLQTMKKPGLRHSSDQSPNNHNNASPSISFHSNSSSNNPEDDNDDGYSNHSSDSDSDVSDIEPVSGTRISVDKYLDPGPEMESCGDQHPAVDINDTHCPEAVERSKHASTSCSPVDGTAAINDSSRKTKQNYKICQNGQILIRKNKKNRKKELRQSYHGLSGSPPAPTPMDSSSLLLHPDLAVTHMSMKRPRSKTMQGVEKPLPQNSREILKHVVATRLNELAEMPLPRFPQSLDNFTSETRHSRRQKTTPDCHNTKDNNNSHHQSRSSQAVPMSHQATRNNDDSSIIPSPNTSSSCTQLHQAIETDNLKRLSILLLRHEYADIDATNRLGQTALHLASLHDSIEAMELLIKNGASVNVIDQVGLSPLAYAVDAGNFDGASLLISNGANISEVKDGF